LREEPDEPPGALMRGHPDAVDDELPAAHLDAVASGERGAAGQQQHDEDREPPQLAERLPGSGEVHVRQPLAGRRYSPDREPGGRSHLTPLA
jgi:hypothetical protein